MPVTMTLRKNLKPHTCTHTHQQVAYQLTTSEKQIRQSKKTKPPYSCPYFFAKYWPILKILSLIHSTRNGKASFLKTLWCIQGRVEIINYQCNIYCLVTKTTVLLIFILMKFSIIEIIGPSIKTFPLAFLI